MRFDPALHEFSLLRCILCLQMLQNALGMQGLHPIRSNALIRSEEILYEAPTLHGIFKCIRNLQVTLFYFGFNLIACMPSGLEDFPSITR